MEQINSEILRQFEAKGLSINEGVAVDAEGNVYGAEVGPKGVKKYVLN